MVNEGFTNSFEFKVIYVMRINDNAHKGLLKIGDATVHTNKGLGELAPNCEELNSAAKKRIDEYTSTAGIEYQLLYTELAVRTIQKNGNLSVVSFRDHDVQKVLENSGFKHHEFANAGGKEWYPTSLETVKIAIEAVKNGHKSIKAKAVAVETNPIIFRPEQRIAIDRTIAQFKHGSKMLWNAKMRFGKTICALQVIKEEKFHKTIIFTHRPDVENGWFEDFTKIFYESGDYIFSSKKRGGNISQLDASGKNYIYFASIQDLRGSKEVGGKFDKNNEVFKTKWDLTIIDEAHEGTTTELGIDTIRAILKENTNMKFLALSGTPFNIVTNFTGNEVYTWDYIDEQKAKHEWDLTHFGDSNPYEELPEMKIYTYDLGQLITGERYISFEDKAFNFREFFRVWTGNLDSDYEPMPANAKIGEFVHEKDVMSFLNLMTADSKVDHYPYSTPEYRKLFKHTLWIVPGVKEAKALKDLMLKNSVFGSGYYDIVNVAGDEEAGRGNALDAVKDAIKNQEKLHGGTITLSCGKLTTGVTIREWTAVFMLAGSYSTSAAQYLQTIFRVQSPCNHDGKIKTQCYVFDFAPDRTLKMVSEAVSASTKAGKTTEGDRNKIGAFLNYCPVISIKGSIMKPYNTSMLLQHLKRAYAERIVRNGFDDAKLYNDKLLKLDNLALQKFKKLKRIVGSSKAQPKMNDILINDQGLNHEESEKARNASKKKPKDRTPEEKALLEKLKKERKARNDAISILRGISIRMPLLIYGADVPFNEDINLTKFIDMIDNESWEEFMPQGVTKDKFKEFLTYYDEDIFVAAARNIRNITRGADDLDITERIKKIALLFSGFKNPDKETVLTPWRVVNMQLSDTIGGYDFFDDSHEKTLDTPRFVDRGEITKRIYDAEDPKILEINSKTGLYPLYMAYSVYRSKINHLKSQKLTLLQKKKIWAEVVRKNIFVICKTKMAAQITKRTLVGYNLEPTNAKYFKGLLEMLDKLNKGESDKFVRKINNTSTWGERGKKMKWSAVVGNPPYQKKDGGGNGGSATPIYHLFVKAAKNIQPQYISLITPSRWFTGGKGLDDYRAEMLHDDHIRLIQDYPDSSTVFSGVQIKGGVSYFLWDRDNRGKCEVNTHINGEIYDPVQRYLPVEGCDTFIRYNIGVDVWKKVREFHEESFMDLVSARMPFGITNKFKGHKKIHSDDVIIYVSGNDRSVRGSTAYISRNEIPKGKELIDCHKVYIPKAGSGSDSFPHSILTPPFYGAPGTVCNETYLVIGPFDSKEICQNVISYIHTQFFRFMVLLKKDTQNAAKGVYGLVPMQNFSKPLSDEELYKKYGLNAKEVEFIQKMIKPMK